MNYFKKENNLEKNKQWHCSINGVLSFKIRFSSTICRGNYMEPDLKFGRGYLEALRDALKENEEKTNQ